MLKKPTLILTILFFLYVVIYSSHALFLKKTVYGDGAYYYSWLHSIVIDHDINFSDEFIHFNLSQPFTANGMPINKYAIGPSLLWLPAYLYFNTIILQDGYTFPYQFIIGLVTVFYVYIGLLLLYRLLQQRVKPAIAVCTIVLIACATHLLFYGAVDPVNSHGLSFFAVSLFLTFLVQDQPFGIGIALALVALIRPQDSVIVLLLIPYLSKKNILPILTGFFLLFSHQLLVWFAFTGNPFISPYFVGGEHYDFLHPHLLSVLFSPENGLFLYTPLVAIALVGFWKPWKRAISHRGLTFLCIILMIYLIASWSSFDQGASFSGRMFVGMLPLLAFPIAQLLTRMMNRLITLDILYLMLVFPLSGVNVLLILYFLLTHR